LLGRVLNKLKRMVYRPSIPVTPVPGILVLGSHYGGWHFMDTETLRGATVISAGLGEDASFDVELAAKYGCKVVIVDPTPRSVQHFEAIAARLGKAAESRYADSGKQPPTAYDLSAMGAQSLDLIPCALWISNEPVKFFPPRDPSHVSYSITDLQRNFSQAGDYIEVPSITMPDIASRYGLSRIALFKLDIEGAETQVLAHMLASGIFPDQLLVEYDEIHVPSAAGKAKCEACDLLLRENGYLCVHRAGETNFTYVRRQSFGL